MDGTHSATLALMTFRSGSGWPPRHGGQQLISTRFYAEPIIIEDTDIRADEAEREAAERAAADQEAER